MCKKSISVDSFSVKEMMELLQNLLNGARPRGYKTFFMLNSVEHEILNAHKYINIKKFGFFRLR